MRHYLLRFAPLMAALGLAAFLGSDGPIWP